jgi:hypothetical protein
MYACIMGITPTSRVRRPRPVIRAVCVLACACIVGFLGAGSYLVMHECPYPYMPYTYSFPGTNNNHQEWSAEGHHFFVRTPDGARLGLVVGPQPPWHRDIPDGPVLGSAKYRFVGVMEGFPEWTKIDWTLESISDIEPSPDGPPTSDKKAWHDIVAQASTNIQYGYTLPHAILDGDDHAISHYPMNFVYDAFWWVLHAPFWLAGALLFAVGVTMADFALGRKSRRRAAGLCVHCGYDRKGIAGDAVCPECGRPA